MAVWCGVWWRKSDPRAGKLRLRIGLIVGRWEKIGSMIKVAKEASQMVKNCKENEGKMAWLFIEVLSLSS